MIVQKQHRFSQVLKGIPSILVHDGQLNLNELAKNHIESEQLRSLLRSQDCFSLKEAKYVILETSVMKNEEVRSTLAVLLIDEGFKKAEEIVYAE